MFFFHKPSQQSRIVNEHKFIETIQLHCKRYVQLKYTNNNNDNNNNNNITINPKVESLSQIMSRCQGTAPTGLL